MVAHKTKEESICPCGWVVRCRRVFYNKQLRNTVTRFTIGQELFEHHNTVSSVRTLTALYSHVSDYIPYTGASAFNNFQQMILALHYMRQDSSHSDLSQKFRIKTLTSARLFLTVLDVLYSWSKWLIHWPDSYFEKQCRCVFMLNFNKEWQSLLTVSSCILTGHPTLQQDPILGHLINIITLPSFLSALLHKESYHTSHKGGVDGQVTSTL